MNDNTFKQNLWMTIYSMHVNLQATDLAIENTNKVYDAMVAKVA